MRTRVIAIACLVWVVGCGGDDGGDANDGGTAATGTCGMAIAVDDIPDFSPDAAVLFSRPDGSVIGVETVPANGVVVRGDCIDDTTISLFAPRIDAGANQYSYFGVGRDVVVTFDPISSRRPSASLPAISVLLEDSPSAATVDTQYAVIASCGGTQVEVGVAISITPGCEQGNGNVSLFAIAGNDDGDGMFPDFDGDEFLAFDWAVDQAPTVGSVALSNWRLPSRVQVRIVEPRIRPSSVHYDLVYEGVEYRRFVDDNPENLLSDYLGEFDVPTGFPGEPRTGVVFNGTTEHRVVFGFELGQIGGDQLLPVLGGVLIDESGARPSVSWTSQGSLAEADYGIVELPWTAGTSVGSIRAIVPATYDSLQLPEIPEELSDSAVPEGATYSQPTAKFVDHSFSSDYDELLVDRRSNMDYEFDFYDFPYPLVEGSYRTTRFPGY